MFGICVIFGHRMSGPEKRTFSGRRFIRRNAFKTACCITSRQDHFRIAASAHIAICNEP